MFNKPITRSYLGRKFGIKEVGLDFDRGHMCNTSLQMKRNFNSIPKNQNDSFFFLKCLWPQQSLTKTTRKTLNQIRILERDNFERRDHKIIENAKKKALKLWLPRSTMITLINICN